MKFKEALLHVHEMVSELAKAAEHLDNQNLADVIKSGMVKIAQAAEHPDTDKVDEAAKAAPPPFPGAEGGQPAAQ